jgi:hypothetical protein
MRICSWRITGETEEMAAVYILLFTEEGNKKGGQDVGVYHQTSEGIIVYIYCI